MTQIMILTSYIIIIMIMYRLSIDYSIKNKDDVCRYDHDQYLMVL